MVAAKTAMKPHYIKKERDRRKLARPKIASKAVERRYQTRTVKKYILSENQQKWIKNQSTTATLSIPSVKSVNGE